MSDTEYSESKDSQGSVGTEEPLGETDTTLPNIDYYQASFCWDQVTPDNSSTNPYYTAPYGKIWVQIEQYYSGLKGF